VAEKCHSAGTPKSDLWKHSYESYLPGGCPEKLPNVSGKTTEIFVGSS